MSRNPTYIPKGAEICTPNSMSHFHSPESLGSTPSRHLRSTPSRTPSPHSFYTPSRTQSPHPYVPTRTPSPRKPYVLSRTSNPHPPYVFSRTPSLHLSTETPSPHQTHISSRSPSPYPPNIPTHIPTYHLPIRSPTAPSSYHPSTNSDRTLSGHASRNSGNTSIRHPGSTPNFHPPYYPPTRTPSPRPSHVSGSTSIRHPPYNLNGPDPSYPSHQTKNPYLIDDLDGLQLPISSGFNEMRISIQEDFSGIEMGHHRTDLIRQLDHVLKKLDRGLGYLRQHNPEFSQLHLWRMEYVYQKLREMLLRVDAEARAEAEVIARIAGSHTTSVCALPLPCP